MLTFWCVLRALARVTQSQSLIWHEAVKASLVGRWRWRLRSETLSNHRANRKTGFQDRWKIGVCNYGFLKIKININRRIRGVGQRLVCFRASERTIEAQFKTEFTICKRLNRPSLWLQALTVVQHQLKSIWAVMYSLSLNMPPLCHYSKKNPQLVLATKRGRATERMRGQERHKQKSKGERTRRVLEDTTRWGANRRLSPLHAVALWCVSLHTHVVCYRIKCWI